MSNIYSILFLVMGLVTGLGTFFQTYMFNIAGVRLTSRLRLETFKTMMKQEMAWFDSAKNSVGALCTRLSSDCSGVQGVSINRFVGNTNNMLITKYVFCIWIGNRYKNWGHIPSLFHYNSWSWYRIIFLMETNPRVHCHNTSCSSGCVLGGTLHGQQQSG